MVELKGLEDWARGILAIPTTELNQRFGNSKSHDEIRDSIAKLPFFSHYRPIFRSLSEPTLLQLHQKLRGEECETYFWDLMLISLDHALPDAISFDLIARYPVDSHLIHMLGHSRQSDEVMWRLAPLIDEALLTLAKSFYTDSNHRLEELEEALRQFPDHEWMLESLAHCSASSFEKRRAYELATENHPQREKWLRLNREIDPHQPPFTPFDLSRSSESERMKALYGGYNSERLLNFARDDQTPAEILRELEELRGFPDAAKIRAAARHTLGRREEESL